jgi:hypothetical protein
MTSDKERQQELEWKALHDRITATLDQFGQKDAFGKGDYWLLDENWGWRRQQLEFQNLSLFQPKIINLLRALLADFPDWDITIRVDVPGTEDAWPGMGLIVYHDEIIDELQRQYFPEEFRHFVYEGGKRRFD